MEEREPLRLTFELPAQALDQAARLLEAAPEQLEETIDALILSRGLVARELDTDEGAVVAVYLPAYYSAESEVARRLGIGRSTLYRKVREQGIEVDLKEAG